MFSFFYCVCVCVWEREREREREKKKKKKKKKKKSFTRRNIALSNLVEHYSILQKNEWGVTCGTFFKDSWLLCSSNWLKNVLKSRLLMCNSYIDIFEEICIKIVHFLCENMIYPLMPIYIFNLPCGIIFVKYCQSLTNGRKKPIVLDVCNIIFTTCEWDP